MMKSGSVILNTACLLILIGMNNIQSSAHRTMSIIPSNKHISQGESTNRRDEYKHIRSGRGIGTSFRSFELWDGTTIFTQIEFFRSTKTKETKFKTNIDDLSEIIERSSLQNIKGEVTGERIVGKHYPDEKGIVKYSVIRNYKLEIHYIESTSLDHILNFEKKAYTSQK